MLIEFELIYYDSSGKALDSSSGRYTRADSPMPLDDFRAAVAALNNQVAGR